LELILKYLKSDYPLFGTFESIMAHVATDLRPFIVRQMTVILRSAAFPNIDNRKQIPLLSPTTSFSLKATEGCFP